ncbi:MAG: extracellular solute-binding protein [Oscillospiraceae bacterium]|nr:extracellular solute-binding protein [Oscillospiraceae bacterium]
MKDIKKILAGAMALTITAGLSACGSDGGNSAETTTAAAAETTTAVTVEKNTETLAAEEEDALETALSQLQDVELANKEIKWLAHYDINPGGNGASKKVELELFERKYGGSIKWYETVYENRFNDLSTYMLGGEGIDFFPSEAGNFPKAIISGMFQPVDEYIDMDSDIWQNTAEAMKIYNFGNKHYTFVTNVRANYYVYYNKETIEANGLDDPWELYKAGEWNWDTFKAMLQEFVDEENEQYGLDNWFNELALLYSAGIPVVQSVDGQIQCNLNDPVMEKAMNFQYDLYNSGLVAPAEVFQYKIHPEMMADGRQLFWIGGFWEAEGDPEVWAHGISPENLGFVPTPSPADSDPYQAAAVEGYVLCKGASNPEGVARFAECTIVAVNDPNSIAISERKIMDDSKWPQELIDKTNEINALAKQYPIVDLVSGCSADVESLTTASAESAVRAPFHGTDWPSTRETYADAVNGLVEEINAELQAALAEG